MELLKKTLKNPGKSKVGRKSLLAEYAANPEKDMFTKVRSSLLEILNRSKKLCVPPVDGQRLYEYIDKEESEANELRNFYIPELEAEKDEKFKHLICVLNRIAETKEQDAFVQTELDDINNQSLDRDALDAVVHFLRNTSNEKHEMTWNLANPYCMDGEKNKVSVECRHTDIEELTILDQYILDCQWYCDSDGYGYTMEIDPDMSKIEMPFSDVAEIKVNGNCISNNCSCYEVPVTELYAFYLTDMKKNAVVYKWKNMQRKSITEYEKGMQDIFFGVLK